MAKNERAEEYWCVPRYSMENKEKINTNPLESNALEFKQVELLRRLHEFYLPLAAV